jgi:tryptophanyl-tRNA synthetase
MTQFRSKSSNRKSVGTGLLTYPVLQAADILLYLTDFVPVGEDQKQHVELTREIAQRFNSKFGEVFVLPDVIIRNNGARLMAFDDPMSKMSKSIGERIPGHAVGLLDPPDVIQRTIMRAVTDSGKEVRFEQASPGVRNLLSLYEALSGESVETISERFSGRGYGALKKTLVDLIVTTLKPIRTRWKEIITDPGYLDGVLTKGAERARTIAAPVLARAKQAVGLGR